MNDRGLTATTPDSAIMSFVALLKSAPPFHQENGSSMMKIDKFILSAVFLFACSFAPDAHSATDLCAENHHSVAVLIGNKDYRRNIPEVPFAKNDAEAIKKFLIDRLCYREGNIIHLENATYGDFINTFGDTDSPDGTLWNWVRPGRSNVFVYYSGHGAPDIRTGDGFLVPVDGDPDNPKVGLSLQTLVTNLKVLKDQRVGDGRDVTLVLDACFSGKEGTGKALIKGSFSGWKPRRPDTGDSIIRFSAAAADEIARWDEDRKLGLFTRVFLDAVAGKADEPAGFGDGDGVVTPDELSRYIGDEVAYFARRRYRTDQTPELPAAERIRWRLAIDADVPDRPPVHECDRLAADPDDIEKVATGVVLHEMQASAALRACQAAIAEHPDAMRFQFQHARALEALGQYDKAQNLYRSLEEHDYAQAMFRLGVNYEFGFGSAAMDLNEAIHWYGRAAEMGNFKALDMLAKKYLYGIDVPENPAEAVRWYRLAVDKGSASAMVELATIYRWGWYGVEQDVAEALRLRRKAAALGDAKAMYELAGMYDYDSGVPRDEKEAVRWYRAASENGHSSAMHILAKRYSEGRGIAKNDAEAVRWLRKSSDLGNPYAMLDLGKYFQEGRGVVRDDKAAFRWFKKAAESDVLESYVSIGLAYYKGVGVEKNETEAANWFLKAAEEKDADAAFYLGTMFFNGRGVERDEQKSAEWTYKSMIYYIF